MPNDINELDVNDIGLKQVMGSRFQDETAENFDNEYSDAPSVKAAQKPTQKPRRDAVKYAQDFPVAEPSFPQKLLACGKKAAVYAGLCLLVFYWQQTGQMEPSAAVPCMMACTTMVGVTYGRVFAKEMF